MQPDDTFENTASDSELYNLARLKVKDLGKDTVTELFNMLREELHFLAKHPYEPSDIQQARDIILNLRNDCLGIGEFDADGAVILSHAIRWLHFKIEGKPYERPKD